MSNLKPLSGNTVFSSLCLAAMVTVALGAGIRTVVVQEPVKVKDKTVAGSYDWMGFCAGLHESYVRELAISRVMPSYPEEAVRRGISGVLRLKIEISDKGEVLKIKVKPGTDPLLKKAAADATRQWQFKPNLDPAGLGRSSLGRLTFVFVIRKGEGLVELYNPGPDAPDRERLGYYDSPKELREWKDWEEITEK